jgi:hypothetical protein
VSKGKERKGKGKKNFFFFLLFFLSFYTHPHPLPSTPTHRPNHKERKKEKLTLRRRSGSRNNLVVRRRVRVQADAGRHRGRAWLKEAVLFVVVEQRPRFRHALVHGHVCFLAGPQRHLLSLTVSRPITTSESNALDQLNFAHK